MAQQNLWDTTKVVLMGNLIADREKQTERETRKIANKPKSQQKEINNKYLIGRKFNR